MARDEVAGIECILPPAGARQATRRHFATYKRRKTLLIATFQHFDLLTIGSLEKVSAIDHGYIDKPSFLHGTERFSGGREYELQRPLGEPCLNNGAVFGAVGPKPICCDHPTAGFQDPDYLAVQSWLIGDVHECILGEDHVKAEIREP